MCGLVVLVAAAVGTASPALAQSAYVGASGGVSKWDLDCENTSQCDKSDSTYKLFGGYQINDNFAVEAAYVSLGKTTSSVDFIPGVRLSGDLKASGLEVAGVARAPFGAQWHGFAKLGLSSMKAKSTVVLNGINLGSESDRATKPLFGLGVSYQATKQLGVRAEWENRKVKFVDDDASVNSFTVGVQYSF